MKGLALSRLFYEEQVKPLLTQKFSGHLGRMAVGLVGEGSQCFGYDDELSQDHDWGAEVCIWLPLEDYEAYGAMLQKALLELPNTFHGYPVVWIPGRNGVLEIGAFYKKYLGVNGIPQTIGQWLNIPEDHLAVATNGEVFEDPLGKFLTIRKELQLGYPEDIRKKKLAARCMKIAQSGQYNYPRVLARGDKTAAALAEGEFLSSVLSAVYLLNGAYAPFYKWMAHGVRFLPKLGKEISVLLQQLNAFPTPGTEEEAYYVGKIETMRQICALLQAELQRQGLSDSDDPFFVEQGLCVHRTIAHEGLRATNPWVEK